MSSDDSSIEASSIIGSEIETPPDIRIEESRSILDSYLLESDEEPPFYQTKSETRSRNVSTKISDEPSKKRLVWTPVEPVKKKVNAGQLTQRFQEFQHKVHEKISNLARELQEVQTKECTFKPNLKETKPSRTFSEFIKEQERFQIVKQEKISRLKKEQEEKKEKSESYSYHPSLSNRSAKESSTHSASSVFEKLYNETKTSSFKPTRSSFEPKVNRKSSELKRNETVDTLLYRDAVRRMSKSEVEVKKESSISTSSNSQKLLKEKFSKEFSEVFTELDVEKKRVLNYMKFRTLLNNLKFIKNEPGHPYHIYEKELVIKAWHLLVEDGESYVEEEDLKNFLLGVLNLGREPAVDSSTTVVSINETTISLGDNKKIHRAFNLFYENRTLVNPKPKSVSPASSESRSQLTKMTLKLAENLENKRKILYGNEKKEDILIREKKQIQEKIAEKKEEMIKEEIKSCTFRPRINEETRNKKLKEGTMTYEHNKLTSEIPRHEALFSLSRIRNDRLKQNQTDREESMIEKSMEECSFTPNINRSSSNRSQRSSVKRLSINSSSKTNTESRTPKAMRCGIDFTHKSKSAFESPKAGSNRIRFA